jgi:Kef-type K+ transport system membrane component KefB
MFEGMLNDIWFKLTLLLVVALASNFLFSRFGQPKIIGQILLGILIGPSVLGLIGVSSSTSGIATGNIFDQLPEIGTIATLGAIILLFIIGLECNMKEIYTKSSIVVATSGVILPWVCGFLLADYMLPEPATGTKFAVSVMIGAALVATSVAITAGVLRELGVIGSRPAKIILGAAVVDDVLGMIVFAISSELAVGTDIQVMNIIWIVLAAVVFVGVGAFIGSRYISKLIGAVERRGAKRNLPESGFLLALAFAFLYAFIAQSIGISAIVGAFVAGTSLANSEHVKKFSRSTEVLGWVFTPIFFIALGILVNIQLSLESWIFALVLTLVAAATKLAGCGIPARLMKMSNRESLAVGLGMIPRMEIAMMIALFALWKGVISQEIYSVIILMGLLTALFTAPFLKWAMKGTPRVADERAIERTLQS